MKTINETNRGDNIEMLPRPIEPRDAFPLKVSIARVEGSGVADFNRGRVGAPCEEERIEVGSLGETGEDSERCWYRILQAEIDSTCGLRLAILVSLDNARDLAARIAQDGFPGQESVVFIPA